MFWKLCHFINILSDMNPLRLLQAAQNRSSVQKEIKKSICSLILEINKKGKMLMSHLEVCQNIPNLWQNWTVTYTCVLQHDADLELLVACCGIKSNGALLVCRHSWLVYPEAWNAYPRAVGILQMFIYLWFSGCNKGSWDCLTKTTGRHRLPFQTPGSCHPLHQMGHCQEREHGALVL